MKKLGLVVTGFATMLVLGACSDEGLNEVVDTHNEFNDILEGEDTETLVGNIQNLLVDYDTGGMEKEEFEDKKDEYLTEVDKLEEELDSVDEPEGERAKEYYNLSYDMVTKSIEGIHEALDTPEDLEDEDDLLEYQERVGDIQEEEQEAIKKVEEMREEMEEDGVEFEES